MSGADPLLTRDSAQTTEHLQFAGIFKLSDGLEPSTPLPCAADGNGSQRTATVSAYSRRFRADPICHRSPTVATTGLHKGPILCSLERQRVRTAAARVPSGAVGSYVALAFGSWTGAIRPIRRPTTWWLRMDASPWPLRARSWLARLRTPNAPSQSGVDLLSTNRRVSTRRDVGVGQREGTAERRWCWRAQGRPFWTTFERLVGARAAAGRRSARANPSPRLLPNGSIVGAP